MISLRSKSQSLGYNVGISQENSTRSLFLIRVLYTKSSWSVLLIINSALMSMLLSHVRLMATMLYTYALTSSSRSFYHILGLMTLCHVTHHVTVMSHASSSSLKRKEIQKKRNIKSRKIDKRKGKMLMSKAFHNIRRLL